MLHVALALVTLAQSAPAERRLTTPVATHPHEFSQIRGARQLADGRVLVTDWIEEVVGVADFSRGTFTPLGRKGTGPREYRLPTALIPLPGDSTLLVDEGNARLAVISPGLQITRSFSNNQQGMRHGVTPRAVDSRERFYFEIPAWAETSNMRSDSVTVARWDPGTGRVERLVRVKGITYRSNTMTPGLPYVLFAARDGWQVDQAGNIVVVRSADYRVEWHGTDGRVVRGPPTPHRRLATTRRDRLDHIRRFMNSAVTAQRGGTMAPEPESRKSEKFIAELTDAQEFAPVRPPFTDRAPLLGDGLLWVERSLPAGSPATYDRFDAKGARKSAVVLPVGRRLLMLAPGFLYAIATDEDGLERLERYRVPPV